MHTEEDLKVQEVEVAYLDVLGLDVTATNLEQLRVFAEALKIFHSRDKKYGSLWQQYPSETMLMHMQSKLSRCGANTNPCDMDDAIDLLNYTAFFIRLAPEVVFG